MWRSGRGGFQAPGAAPGRTGFCWDTAPPQAAAPPPPPQQQQQQQQQQYGAWESQAAAWTEEAAGPSQAWPGASSQGGAGQRAQALPPFQAPPAQPGHGQEHAGGQPSAPPRAPPPRAPAAAPPTAPPPASSCGLTLERYRDLLGLLTKGSGAVQPLSELESSMLKMNDLKQVRGRAGGRLGRLSCSSSD